MRRAIRIMALVIAGVGLCWLLPPFRIVSLQRAAQEKTAGEFDAAKFADTFWSDTLLKSLGQAVKADVLMAAVRADPAAARKKFSHSVGLSDAYFYFLSGAGRVLSVSDSEISLAVTDGATNAEIILQTGPLFGNAVRDGTGLINVNDYANSQDFNDISTALNRIVETRVLPDLRKQARVGTPIRFTGCAEVDDESADSHPLRVVPIQAEVQ